MAFQSLTVYFTYPGRFTQVPFSPFDNREIIVASQVNFLSDAKLSTKQDSELYLHDTEPPYVYNVHGRWPTSLVPPSPS